MKNRLIKYKWILYIIMIVLILHVVFTFVVFNALEVSVESSKSTIYQYNEYLSNLEIDLDKIINQYQTYEKDLCESSSVSYNDSTAMVGGGIIQNGGLSITNIDEVYDIYLHNKKDITEKLIEETKLYNNFVYEYNRYIQYPIYNWITKIQGYQEYKFINSINPEV